VRHRRQRLSREHDCRVLRRAAGWRSRMRPSGLLRIARLRRTIVW
jgi:hypothetical protein